MLGSDSSLPPPSFKATQVASKIQFAARNIHLTHMNLCSLDVDAFLYASGKEIFNTDVRIVIKLDFFKVYEKKILKSSIFESLNFVFVVKTFTGSKEGMASIPAEGWINTV
jgi:hypothetical protein